MTTYWCSVPTWSVIVEVSEAGLITHTAPYMKRTWLGKAWAKVRASLATQWGTGLRVQAIPS